MITPTPRAVRLFLDSGAYSWVVRSFNKAKEDGRNVRPSYKQHKFGRVDTGQFEYAKTPEYLEFRQAYADFLKEHRAVLDIYSNLDVIFNPQLTWDNQRWLEDQGLHPTPVWHFGTDEKWLHKYLEAGYDYVCLGGIASAPRPVLRIGLDSLWRRVLTDHKGMPVVKVHGFAMTSFGLMTRYPWYSVDSKSWISCAAYGGILVPTQARDGGYDYRKPVQVKVCRQSAGVKGNVEAHLGTMSSSKREFVLRYLRHIDVPLGESVFLPYREGAALGPGEKLVRLAKSGGRQAPQYRRGPKVRATPSLVERVVEKGVVNTPYARFAVNARFYREFERQVPRWPWPLAAKIKQQGRRGLLWEAK